MDAGPQALRSSHRPTLRPKLLHQKLSFLPVSGTPFPGEKAVLFHLSLDACCPFDLELGDCLTTLALQWIPNKSCGFEYLLNLPLLFLEWEDAPDSFLPSKGARSPNSVSCFHAVPTIATFFRSTAGL